MDISQFGNLLNTVLILAALIAGVLAVRDARKTKVDGLKDETIKILNQKIDAVEGRLKDLERENDTQRYIIETIKAALKQKGMLVTIDGDLVTITDSKGSSVMRRRMGKSAPPQTKEEDA